MCTKLHKHRIYVCDSGLDITTNCCTFSRIRVMPHRTEHKLRWGVDCDMNQQKLYARCSTYRIRSAQHTHYYMELRYFRIHFCAFSVSLALSKTTIWCGNLGVGGIVVAKTKNAFWISLRKLKSTKYYLISHTCSRCVYAHTDVYTSLADAICNSQIITCTNNNEDLCNLDKNAAATPPKIRKFRRSYEFSWKIH